MHFLNKIRKLKLTNQNKLLNNIINFTGYHLYFSKNKFVFFFKLKRQIF